MVNVKQTVNFTQLSKERDKLLNLTQNEVVELVTREGLFYLVSAEHYLTLQAQLSALLSKVTGVPQETVDITDPAIMQELEAKLKQYQHLLEPATSPEVGYYFGCGDQSGHAMFCSALGSSQMRSDMIQRLLPPNLRPKNLDTLIPNDAPQSKIFLHRNESGFSLIAMGDYTVDKRGGSKSIFLIQGEHTAEEMMDLFRQKFPTITKRIEAAKPFYQY